MYKILNLEKFNYSPIAIKKLRSIGFFLDNLSNCKKDEVDILICRLKYKLDRNFLAKFKKLKYILTNTTGLNHVDLDYCKKNKIKIFSLKGHRKFLNKITSTAELYIGLIFLLLRNLPSSIKHVNKKNWDRDKFLGNNLFGKNVGIYGLGRNGLLLAKYCKALKMNVTYFDKISNIKQFKRVKSLKLFLKNIDILAVCINYNPKNHKIIDKKFLNLLPNHSVLINCARGELICEKSLLSQLKSKKIRGAALDVLANEQNRNKKINKLISYSKKNSNLIITPHLGGATVESWKMTEEYVANNLVKYVKKQKK